jgi:hypothetical protein
VARRNDNRDKKLDVNIKRIYGRNPTENKSVDDAHILFIPCIGGARVSLSLYKKLFRRRFGTDICQAQ